MKKIFVILFFLTSCGYQPLYSNKTFADFTFKDIELIGDIKINRQILTTLNVKKSSENFQFRRIILDNNKQIIETSKNSKGQADSYKMVLSVNLTIESKNNILNEKFFSETFSYKNLSNKFDLSQYEKEVENNLIKKITEQLIVHLNL
tara:strand:- start:55 stop:498 length:444 start_codon:yes stop_codon:yes gene_type:complete